MPDGADQEDDYDERIDVRRAEAEELEDQHEGGGIEKLSVEVGVLEERAVDGGEEVGEAELSGEVSC